MSIEIKDSLVRIAGTREVPHLLLNRPNQANALNAMLLSELVTALESVVGDGVRAVVLAGEGIPSAMSASKTFLNALDSDVVDLATWQQKRRDLLASNERQAAFRGRRERKNDQS